MINYKAGRDDVLHDSEARKATENLQLIAKKHSTRGAKLLSAIIGSPGSAPPAAAPTASGASVAAEAQQEAQQHSQEAQQHSQEAQQHSQVQQQAQPQQAQAQQQERAAATLQQLAQAQQAQAQAQSASSSQPASSPQSQSSQPGGAQVRVIEWNNPQLIKAMVDEEMYNGDFVGQGMTKTQALAALDARRQFLQSHGVWDSTLTVENNRQKLAALKQERSVQLQAEQLQADAEGRRRQSYVENLVRQQEQSQQAQSPAQAPAQAPAGGRSAAPEAAHRAVKREVKRELATDEAPGWRPTRARPTPPKAVVVSFVTVVVDASAISDDIPGDKARAPYSVVLSLDHWVGPRDLCGRRVLQDLIAEYEEYEASAGRCAHGVRRYLVDGIGLPASPARTPITLHAEFAEIWPGHLFPVEEGVMVVVVEKTAPPPRQGEASCRLPTTASSDPSGESVSGAGPPVAPPSPNPPLWYIDNIPITQVQLDHLQPGELLDDDNVAVYLTMVLQHMQRLGITDVCLVRTWLFFELILTRGPIYVRKWTSAKHLSRYGLPQGSKTIFDARYFVAPVHAGGNHWIWALVDFKECCIHVHDSLSQRNNSNYAPLVYKTLLRWLDFESKDKTGEILRTERWSIGPGWLPMPQQQNVIDCGVFMLLTISRMVVSARWSDVRQRDIDQVRSSLIKVFASEQYPGKGRDFATVAFGAVWPHLPRHQTLVGRDTLPLNAPTDGGGVWRCSLKGSGHATLLEFLQSNWHSHGVALPCGPNGSALQPIASYVNYVLTSADYDRKAQSLNTLKFSGVNRARLKTLLQVVPGFQAIVTEVADSLPEMLGIPANVLELYMFHVLRQFSEADGGTGFANHIDEVDESKDTMLYLSVSVKLTADTVGSVGSWMQVDGYAPVKYEAPAGSVVAFLSRRVHRSLPTHPSAGVVVKLVLFFRVQRDSPLWAWYQDNAPGHTTPLEPPIVRPPRLPYGEGALPDFQTSAWNESLMSSRVASTFSSLSLAACLPSRKRKSVTFVERNHSPCIIPMEEQDVFGGRRSHETDDPTAYVDARASRRRCRVIEEQRWREVGVYGVRKDECLSPSARPVRTTRSSAKMGEGGGSGGGKGGGSGGGEGAQPAAPDESADGRRTIGLTTITREQSLGESTPLISMLPNHLSR